MSAKREKLPKHVLRIYKSAHGFRASKRAALRRALKALDDARIASCWMPDGSGPKTWHATRLIEEVLRACSVKNWGR